MSSAYAIWSTCVVFGSINWTKYNYMIVLQKLVWVGQFLQFCGFNTF